MSLIELERGDGIATLTLNDPERRNTMTLPMVREILAAMDDVEADESVNVVIVTGAGKGFCAGADLSDLEVVGEDVSGIYEGFLRIARSPLPTIAAVNGAAVGAGMNLALCCDLRVASTKAKFITRFLELGLHPGGGHTWMMRRAVGQHAAFALDIFGVPLDGAEAERRGLVWTCVEPDELMDTARALAKNPAEAPRELAIRMKQTLQEMANVDNHPEAVQVELGPQVWSMEKPWFEERMAAIRAQIAARRS